MSILELIKLQVESGNYFNDITEQASSISPKEGAERKIYIPTIKYTKLSFKVKATKFRFPSNLTVALPKRMEPTLLPLWGCERSLRTFQLCLRAGPQILCFPVLMTAHPVYM